MFNGYKQLSLLPDILKWNIDNVSNMSDMFRDCKSISSFPDITEWNIENININGIFKGCKKLKMFLKNLKKGVLYFKYS